MDFTLSKKHEMARTLFKEFAEKEVKPLAQDVDFCVFYYFPSFLLISPGKIKDIHIFSFEMTCKCRKKDGYIAINSYLII